MRLQDKLLQLKKEKKAILAANFYNFETLSGILRAASGLKIPVILQLSESSIRYMGLDIATALAKSALSEYSVEGWLHLDHGGSIESVKACLDAGSDPIMIEAIQNGICKLNLATETKNIFMRALQQSLKDNEEIDLRILFPEVIEAVKDLVRKKLTVINPV